ncbi:VUT family protein [Amycolatopsis umgeniensis]|uniref:Uncharacterized PurR-regulated membrane protein YhhQ (DUF165 family) n=1 Tax=Amycolatopsis umgeniensis TaxID=336628 RepID=A0A841BAV8_9PSEU|nr:VUT family protein [Amycolatopsis umgeniensis]MBB5856447.1 uncharacterized PurR-regulated membrane protein YhhQ (DUF165 family) [Amycolatopsis umgeniensis]
MIAAAAGSMSAFPAPWCCRSFAPVMGWLAAGCYLVAVAGANWASAHHLLTVGGLAVPAGAWIAGMVFVARDLLHETLGLRGVLAAIGAGTALSAIVASPRIAVASAAAFAVSELADSWLYRRWRSRGRAAAIAGSNLAGLIVDSAVFVPFAFGSWALPGQLAGKAAATAAVCAVLALWSRRPGVAS